MSAPSPLPPGSPGQSEDVADALARAHAGDPVRVAMAAAALHRPVHDEDALTDLLQRATSTAVAWLPDADYAGITIQFDREPFTAAETDPSVTAIDTLQYALDDGPCMRAMRSASIVSMSAAEVQSTWPAFADESAARGVRSFLAAPLVVADQVRGSVNLYSRGTGGFDGDETALIAVLSSYVSRGVADFAALRTTAQQVTQLQEAMNGRAPIEQAKGILMAVHQVDADAAFGILRSQSQRTNTKLRDLAARFVAVQARLPQIPAPGATPHVDLQSAFDHAPVGMALAGPDGRLLATNAALGRLLGRDPDELVATAVLDMVHPDDHELVTRVHGELLTGPHSTDTTAVRLVGTDGEEVPVLLGVSRVLDGEAGVSHLVLSLTDTTVHHALTEQLRHEALHDSLTGLPNRALFLEHLEHGVGRHRRAGAPLSVLFFDVDGFKQINDTHGHAVGDAVLITIGQRLTAMIRPGDTASRWGGDEFAVLCENADATAATVVCHRLEEGLSRPVEVDGKQIPVSVSVGTASSTAGGDHVALLQAADTAMYARKRARR